jgi:hypothetical protein
MSVTTASGDEFMKGKGIIFLVFVLMATVSCMATRFSKVWVDETYQKGPIKDVLVVAIFPNPKMITMIEDEMARQFRSRGISTVLSYIEFSGKQPTKDEVMSRLNKLGIHAVLETKFIKKKRQRSDTGPYPQDAPQDYAIVETSLYDVETQRMIWSALSETWIIGVDSRLTSSFVSSVLKELTDDKLVR